jgi:histone acetyltransferase SAS3
LQPDPVESPSQPKTGAAHLTKELLPAHAGNEEDGFHSIFDNNISDELLNSSRSLRKRKASSVEAEEHVPVLRKRRRQTEHSDSHDTLFDGAADQRADEAASPARPMRPRRTRAIEREHCRIVTKQLGKLVIGFRLEEGKMTKIFSTQSRPLRKKKKGPKPATAPQETQAHFAPIPPAPHVNHFHPFQDRETDESKSKPYGGILSEVEADTSKTLPLQADRDKFEQARQRAEDEWQRKVREAEVNGEATPTASQKVSGPPSKIKYINFGGYEIETWYAAPYPEEYSRNRVLYICEFCLKYMNSDYVAWRHKLKCPAKHPPGDEIYRDGSISIFEVDGRKNPVYCQNLCLLAKLFLGSKTLYYDVEPFLFYVMAEYDDLGCHFVGYFSKEKRPSSANNVSCILTLPIHQRKGYGNLLIDFSYLLTRIEGKSGSPEKPLSDMGLVSYRNYWRLILSYQLRDLKAPVSIADLSDRTGMTADDLVSALEGIRALVRDPITKTYALRLDKDYFEEVIAKWESKGYVQLNPEALTWTPYIMGRNNQSHFDRAPIHTVAPRDDPDEDDEELDSREDADEDTMANGTDTDALGEPAGPPSTAGLPHANGIHAHEPAELEPIPNPAAGIPPSRFELWPPVHVPAPPKRKPGRPHGTFKNHSRTPTTTRTSGRNTPRRASGLPLFTPNANTPSMRRGRSALTMDSPATDATPAQTNGVDESVLGDEEAVLDPSPEDLGLVVDEAETSATGGEAMETEEVEQADVNGDDEPEDAVETNGVNHEEPEATVESDADADADADAEFEPEHPQTPEEKQTSASKSPRATSQKAKGKQSGQATKTPQSVSRKALVEKIQVVVSAEPESGRRRNSKIAASETNGIDSDIDAEGEDDIDGEYEMDGDVVMET